MMTEPETLRTLAKAARDPNRSWSDRVDAQEPDEAETAFLKAVSPETILELLQEIAGLEARLDDCASFDLHLPARKSLSREERFAAREAHAEARLARRKKDAQ